MRARAQAAPHSPMAAVRENAPASAELSPPTPRQAFASNIAAEREGNYRTADDAGSPNGKCCLPSRR